MSSIKTLQEMLSVPGNIYEKARAYPFKLISVKEAMELIDQGIEAYRPLFYTNEKSLEFFRKAKKKLDEVVVEDRDGSYHVAQIYLYALLAGLEKNRGEWNKALEHVEKAQEVSKEFCEQFNDAISNWLAGSILAFQAEVLIGEGKTAEAIESCETAQRQLQRGLSLVQGNESIKRSILYTLQRVHKQIADLALNELMAALAYEHYLATLESARKGSCIHIPSIRFCSSPFRE